HAAQKAVVELQGSCLMGAEELEGIDLAEGGIDWKLSGRGSWGLVSRGIGRMGIADQASLRARPPGEHVVRRIVGCEGGARPPGPWGIQKRAKAEQGKMAVQA